MVPAAAGVVVVAANLAGKKLSSRQIPVSVLIGICLFPIRARSLAMAPLPVRAPHQRVYPQLHPSKMRAHLWSRSTEIAGEADGFEEIETAAQVLGAAEGHALRLTAGEQHDLETVGVLPGSRQQCGVDH